MLETTQKPKWQNIVIDQPGSEHAQTAAIALRLLAAFQSFLKAD
jgi:hypothetical protein